MCYKNVDLTYLEKNSGGNPEFIKGLIETFLKNEANYINELRQIFLEKNQDKFRFYCHKMSSNYATFGATNMVDMIDRIKDVDLQNTSVEEMDLLLNNAKSIHEKVQAELLQIFKKV